MIPSGNSTLRYTDPNPTRRHVTGMGGTGSSSSGRITSGAQTTLPDQLLHLNEGNIEHGNPHLWVRRGELPSGRGAATVAYTRRPRLRQEAHRLRRGPRAILSVLE